MNSGKVYKNALVLSGGSVKGAFQAGVLAELLKVFEPDALYGVSAGGMNACMLANNAGRDVRAGKKPDWGKIGEELATFWEENIHSLGAIAKKRSVLGLGWRILRRKFNGLTSTAPLRKLLFSTISEENLFACPVHFSVGVINVATGKIFYADPSFGHMREYVMGSAAIPLLMPTVEIAGQVLMDGGMRDSAPLKPAIDNGAERIVTVSCLGKDLAAKAFAPGNIGAFTTRVMDVVVNEAISSDIRTAELINELIAVRSGSAMAAGKRHLSLQLIRPAAFPDIDMMKFDKNDICRLVRLGRETALRELDKGLFLRAS